MQMNMRLPHNHVTTGSKPKDPGLQILDQLSELSRQETEEGAIHRIIQMFRCIFPGEEVIYVALHGDLIVTMEPPDTPPDVAQSLVQQSRSTNPGVPAHSIMASYIFPVTSIAGLVGLVALLKKSAAPYKPAPLELGRSAALYAGVVISNIRSLQKLKEDEKLLRKQGNADAQTGLSSRRYFFEIAEAEFKRSKRYDRPLSAMLVDVDGFRAITEQYGAETSERVIQDLSRIFTRELRDSDIRVRLGGEELLILLPETNLRYAQTLAERLRRRVAESTFSMEEYSVNITVSVGVVTLNKSTRTLEEFVNNGDQALHQARHGGGNQVSTWGAPLPEYGPVFTLRETDHRFGFY